MLQHCFSSLQTPARDEGHCHSLSVIFNHLTSTKSEFPAGNEARSSLQKMTGACLQNITGFAVKNGACLQRNLLFYECFLFSHCLCLVHHQCPVLPAPDISDTPQTMTVFDHHQCYNVIER